MVATLLSGQTDVSSLSRFSNRRFEVKHFQAVHCCNVDVTHGLALLFGFAPRPFQHRIRGRGGTIYWAALPSDERQVQAGQANPPHPSSREGHLSTAGGARVSSYRSIFDGRHAAAVACPRSQRNSVKSTQMRCMIRPTGAPARLSPFSFRGVWRSASPRP